MAPLTAAKQTAIIAGLVSLLGGGVQASDITLQSIGDSASQACMQQLALCTCDFASVAHA